MKITYRKYILFVTSSQVAKAQTLKLAKFVLLSRKGKAF